MKPEMQNSGLRWVGIMRGRCYKIYTCCLGQPPALLAVTALLTPDKHQERPGRSLGGALEAQANRDNWPRGKLQR